jgi:hypothetical protein
MRDFEKCAINCTTCFGAFILRCAHQNQQRRFCHMLPESAGESFPGGESFPDNPSFGPDRSGGM